MTDTANMLREGGQASPPGYSSRTLASAVVLSALATAGVMLLVFHVLGVAPWSSRSLLQRGKIFAKGEPMGIVYFETPYASPPQITLETSVDLGGHVVKCKILDQNELGFVWQLLVDGRAQPDPSFGENLTANWRSWLKGAEITWFAKGIQGVPASVASKLTLPQTTVTVEGEDFLSLPKGDMPTEKVVHFKIAFLSPPYLTFPDGVAYGYKITDQKADSFKLQRVIPQEDRNKGKLDAIPTGVVVSGPAPRWELFASSNLKWKAEGQPAK